MVPLTETFRYTNGAKVNMERLGISEQDVREVIEHVDELQWTNTVRALSTSGGMTTTSCTCQTPSSYCECASVEKDTDREPHRFLRKYPHKDPVLSAAP